MDWVLFHPSHWYSPMLSMMTIMPTANTAARTGTAGPAPGTAVLDPAKGSEMPT